MRRERGSVGDILVTGFYLLAITIVMLAYMGNVRLVYRKAEINQVARKYILRMETAGELTDADYVSITRELETLGVTELSLVGTTLDRVPYGDPIVLMIRGKLEGEYEFEEKRVSTAKN